MGDVCGATCALCKEAQGLDGRLISNLDDLLDMSCQASSDCCPQRQGPIESMDWFPR